MTRQFVLLALSTVALTACNQGYERTGKGVVVKTDNNEKIRLEVVSDNIIRVSATPQQFAADQSLIIVPQKGFSGWSVKTWGDSVVAVSTSQITACVSKKDGKVTFCDENGNPIVGEDRRSFSTISAEGKNGTVDGLSFRQVWNSADDEAYYGLGQHQADDFNYKGKNEELYQYNTKVSIPFIVSNKNYGILWDNYSLTRFGDERDYAQLNEAFKVYDKNGNEGGLSSKWIPDAKSGASVLERVEKILFFDNIKANKELLPSGFPLMGSTVTFDGFLEPAETGVYRFLHYYAGYQKVYINDELIVPEIWRTAWNPNSHKFQYAMEAGKKYKIHIDWIPDGGESYCAVRALTPVPDAEQNKLAFWSEMGRQLDYYFIKGQNLDEVISGYRTLTGKAQVMPKWALGFWQSRERYKTQDEILGVLAEFRRRQVPIDNIVQDWSYWVEDQWGAHDFDAARFADPQAMIDSVHAMNGRYMISVWPKFYANTEHYKEFDSKGWMYQQAVKDSIRDWIGQGYIGSFYDAYSAGARKLFWDQMNEHLYKFGIDAWWMDASEPNVRDCTPMDYRKALCGPTEMGPSTEYFNAYALENADAIYNGQRSVNDSSRVFLLTRSGFAGLQRYSTATWSGDIGTRWEDMKTQISAGLNFSISGVPFWTMDVGGFSVENRYVAGQQLYDQTGKENADNKEWKELQARWHQFGAFCPLYRTHGQWPFREIWNIAPEGTPTYNSILYYHKLRYNLMPYIYSLAGMAHFNDYTLMRPLVMDFEQDTKVLNIGDQFMFGPAILVNPVYTYGARSRNVYLPATTGWYDFYTGARYDGGQSITAAAPYERIPLFVREGAIIPVGPDIQYATEVQPKEVTLFVYAGQDGKFTLYEDEGTNYNYEKGKYSMIEFTYNDAAKTLVIAKRNGEFNGMAADRTFNVVLVSKESPVGFSKSPDGKKVAYNGEQVEVKF
ncbi:MAG: DUF5110 domain-containing protein [Bacteroidales bacterium]|nr:DUF5110 domain-containing protein [Bacteroidales bacterium]